MFPQSLTGLRLQTPESTPAPVLIVILVLLLSPEATKNVSDSAAPNQPFSLHAKIGEIRGPVPWDFGLPFATH
jgi:hypothetical protein